MVIGKCAGGMTAAVSYDKEVRAGTVFDADVSIIVRVGVVVNVLIDALGLNVNGIVPDIGVTADLDAGV